MMTEVQHKRPVYDIAKELGLGDAQAKKIAIEACKGEYCGTKFKKFITDNIDESIWERGK